MLKKNKIAVYGVCKDEEYNIREWHSYIQDADYIFLLDTGSTDDTIKIAKELGINIVSAKFSPWSETQAKNTALSLLPEDIDICICLDLDQVIVTKNWKDILSSLDLGFGIAEHTFTTNTGYKDYTHTVSASSIHERFGIGWIRYRPMTFDYNRRMDDRAKVPISVYHLPGTKERFDNRETLYINSFLNELQLVNAYSSRQYFLETYRHIVLSYFEHGDLENFVYHYREFIAKYNSHSFPKEEDEDAFACLYLIQLAMSVYDMKNAIDILKSLNQRLAPQRIVDDINLRIAIHSAISGNFIVGKKHLELVKNISLYPEVIDSILDVINNGINTHNANVLSNYYGNIGWGKSHQKMVNDFIKTQHEINI